MDDDPGTTQTNSEQSGGVAIDGQQVSVGHDVAGGDIITAGRDVAGRDIVATTTTYTGMGAAEVQRLLITVGMLVFVTAACFFSGGVAVGGVAIAALNTPVPKSDEMAVAMSEKLERVADLSSGQSLELVFTEAELCSYVWRNIGPQIGLRDAETRLLGSGRFVVGGQWESLGNSRIAATFHLQEGDTPIKLESAAMQLLPLGDSSFGWVPIPSLVLQPLEDRLNRELGNVKLGPVSSYLQSPEAGAPDGSRQQVEWQIPVTGR
ncbi:MAG: hypothetical protein JW850_17135 [Thermoflexales bacterium]|nr:hypothetical protein [Thermoflexales bacterium]